MLLCNTPFGDFESFELGFNLGKVDVSKLFNMDELYTLGVFGGVHPNWYVFCTFVPARKPVFHWWTCVATFDQHSKMEASSWYIR